MKSPTSKTLEYLRKEGFTCWVVEHWNAFAKIRQDAFGWMDILAYDNNVTIGIQATSASNHAARRNKVLANEQAISWNASPHREIWIVSWAKVKNRYQARIEKL